jgi:hypothetical protein
MHFHPCHTRRFHSESFMSFPDLLIIVFVTDRNRGLYDGLKVWLIRERDRLWARGISFVLILLGSVVTIINYAIK